MFGPHIIRRTFPLKYEQLVLLPFGQHLRLTAVEQDWADQSLVNGEFCLAWKVARLQMFCAVQRSTYLQSGFFVVFSDSPHFLVSSGILGTQILWRLHSVCRQLPRFFSLQWLMSVKLNRPPKPEESQKNSNFNGKTIPYPGFAPGTYGLAVGSHNHCTIGSVICWSVPFFLLFLSL
jgi:hypothetical protein